MYFDVNPFVIHATPDTRLSFWKGLRKTIGETSQTDEKRALDILAEYWGMVPLGPDMIDFENPQDWPSAWEMIHTGDWGRHSVAVGMEMTLRLSGWDSNRMEIIAFRDYDISDEVVVLKIDNQWVLNYTTGKVLDSIGDDFGNNIVVTDSWVFRDRNYVSTLNK